MDQQPQSQQEKFKTHHARGFNDPVERERILRQYGGVFKNNIKEFSEKVLKKHRTQKNFSR